MKAMKALVWEGPHRVRVRSVPEPVLASPRDALITVEHAPICGTDIHFFRGAVPGFQPGTVLGHEFVGRVLEVGDTVAGLHPGMRVRGSDLASCDECAHCRAGHHPQCPERQLFGFSGVQPRLDGALAWRMRVPYAVSVLAPFPEETPARAGVLPADALPTDLGALERAGSLHGRSLAVVGAGPLGLLTAWLAGERGARACLIESDPRRLLHARESRVDVREAAPASADGSCGISERFDIAIDAAGGRGGIETALSLVRPAGTVIGIGSQGGVGELDLGALMQCEIALAFVIGNPIRKREECGPAMAQCTPILERIIPDEVPLDAAPAYYGAMHERMAFKALVKVRGNGC